MGYFKTPAPAVKPREESKAYLWAKESGVLADVPSMNASWRLGVALAIAADRGKMKSMHVLAAMVRKLPLDERAHATHIISIARRKDLRVQRACRFEDNSATALTASNHGNVAKTLVFSLDALRDAKRIGNPLRIDAAQIRLRSAIGDAIEASDVFRN